MRDSKEQPEFVILIPVFNDWDAVSVVLQDLDRALSKRNLRADVLLVDDASTTQYSRQALATGRSAISRSRVLQLSRNLGHQRAIAVGLTYLHENRPYRGVIIMDGDGEDDPRDVPRLLDEFERHDGQKCVFAERVRRSEGFVFSSFYLLYRILHYVLTGQRIRIGNFSVVPFSMLRRLVVVSELWNHYAAAVVHAGFPLTTVPTTRTKRIAGKSNMNFVSLVVHGLSAMSVYADIIGVRLLVAALGFIGLTVIGLAVVIGLRIATDLAIPGWATYTAGIMLVILAQVVTMSLIFALISLSRRQASTFLPVRDCYHFVYTVEEILPETCATTDTAAPS